MEQDNISLQYGMYRTPSLGNDGELSECVNLIPKAGELVNLQEPKIMELAGSSTDYMNNRTLLNTHKYGGIQVYFAYDSSTGRVYYSLSHGAFDMAGTTFGTDETEGSSFVYARAPLVTCYGNIVILTSDNDNRYFIYKNGAFSYLGDSIPSLYLNFGLNLVDGGRVQIFEGDERAKISTVYEDSDLYIHFGLDFDENGWVTGADDDDIPTTVIGAPGFNPREVVTQSVLGYANKFLQEYCYEKNYFAEPFLVRYAYRLYDGNTIMASPPVLMVPSVRPVPEIVARQHTSNAIYLAVVGERCSLDYAQLNKIDTEAWKDIIKSVDIFVSAPLRQYNQAGKVERAETIAHRDSRGYYCHSVTGRGGARDYCEDIILQAGTTTYQLPRFSDTKFNSSVRDCSTFYLIKSIPFSDFDGQPNSSVRHTIDLEEGVLLGLTARESLNDSGIDVSKVVAKGMWEFNNRISIYNYKRYMDNNVPAGVLFPYINARIEYDLTQTPPVIAPNGVDTTPNRVLTISTLEKNGATYIVNKDVSDFYLYPDGAFYINYPDSDATKTRVCYAQMEGTAPNYVDSSSHYSKTYNLSKHGVLNSAVYFEGFDKYIGEDAENISGDIDNEKAGVTPSNMLYVDEKNKILITEEGNPFLLSISHSVTMNGEVLALSSPYKALSQGQFGQFVIAFCSDGIWSLAVNDVGLFSAKTPISRDVCTNPDSITQIDTAVVFVTNQGLKLISGSEVVLLSEAVEGLNVDESEQPDIADAILAFSKKIDPDDYNDINPYVPDNSQFVEQVQTAKIVYDYPHNLLHVFHDFTNKVSEPYTNRHYVYSFDSKQWSTQVLFNNYLKASVPGYPLTTMQFGNALYQYEKLTNSTKHIGYALTRTLSLGDPLSRKALYDLRLIGQRTSQNVVRRVAIFVSNDNVNWVKLPSLKMLSAKYYRILVMSYMSDIDTVSGLSLTYDYRYNHKMRGDVKTGSN